MKRKASIHLVATICCALTLASYRAETTRAAQPVKSYTSAKWGVTLDYPASWSVEDDGDEVTFRADSGPSVVLGRSGGDSPSEPAPGRQTTRPECSTTTTAHGVTAIVCFDALSMTRRATLVLKSRDGVQSRLALRTRGRDAQLFDAIVSSVRAHP